MSFVRRNIVWYSVTALGIENDPAIVFADAIGADDATVGYEAADYRACGGGRHGDRATIRLEGAGVSDGLLRELIGGHGNRDEFVTGQVEGEAVARGKRNSTEPGADDAIIFDRRCDEPNQSGIGSGDGALIHNRCVGIARL